MVDRVLMPCTVALTGAIQEDRSVRFGGFCVANDDYSDFDRGRFLLRLNRWQSDQAGSDPDEAFGRRADEHICYLPGFLLVTDGRGDTLIDYVAWAWETGITLACLRIGDAWIGWDCLVGHESDAQSDRLARIKEIMKLALHAGEQLVGLKDRSRREQGERRYAAQQLFAEAHEALAGENGRLAVRPYAKLRYGAALDAALRQSGALTAPGAVENYGPDEAVNLGLLIGRLKRCVAEDKDLYDWRWMALPGSEILRRSGSSIMQRLEAAIEGASAALPELRAASSAAERSVTGQPRRGPQLRRAAREHAATACPPLATAARSARGARVVPDAALWFGQAEYAALRSGRERRVGELRDTARRAVTLTEDALSFMKLEVLAAQTAWQSTIEYKS